MMGWWVQESRQTDSSPGLSLARADLIYFSDCGEKGWLTPRDQLHSIQLLGWMSGKNGLKVQAQHIDHFLCVGTSPSGRLKPWNTDSEDSAKRF